jgi:transcriptional antiterminator NusG
MVDEEDKVEDLVVDAPEAETAEAAVVEATEVETAEAPVLEATETAEATAVETDEIETAEAAVVEAEVDEAPVVEAIEAEAIEDESVTAEPDLAAAAEASEPAPVEAPVAEATEVPAAEAAVAAAAVKKEPASNRRWYVVHAYSGFESYVKKVLESRIATSEHKKGNRRKSERKFFPGYVLVQMEMDSDTWHLVKQVPKVLGFIGGTSDKPAPISEAEADAILNRVEEGVDKPRPKVLFEVGEVVRVNDGPFNDFNGVVEEVNYEKSKMLVSVQIFGRSTPVELAFGQVEKG